ncbi:MAG: glutamate-5-semialdehyde dehydrogenase, partial [Steroidobacteraceae bacterium]
MSEQTAPQDLGGMMERLGRNALAAASALAVAGTTAKNAALAAAAAAIRAGAAGILEANARDMSAARAAHVTGALLERLALDEKRVESMARGIEEVAALEDPIGTIVAQWRRPNGLRIQRIRVPLG